VKTDAVKQLESREAGISAAYIQGKIFLLQFLCKTTSRAAVKKHRRNFVPRWNKKNTGKALLK